MLYGEFVQGTGCRQNDNNYKLYKRLEILYMNDETMTKEDVYEMGRRLADNSLSEREQQYLEELSQDLTSWEARLKEANEYMSWWKEQEDHAKKMYKEAKADRDQAKANIKTIQDTISEIKHPGSTTEAPRC